MALSTTQQATLGTASRQSVQTCLEKARQNWPNGSWLSAKNRYVVDCVEKIKDHVKKKKPPVHSHMNQYIAASAIVHCFDGWSYFGRALDAELSGDPDAARHLGYYSELRAAMALLATEGIGVFDKQHIVVKSNGRCECMPASGTHGFIWEALQYWAASPAGAKTVFSVVRPGGIPLQEWLKQFSAGATFIATQWLQQWGLDLSRLTEDRDSRNLSSYRPTAFTSPGANPVGDTLTNVRLLWELCEPGAISPFPVVDRHLLRLSLELAFKNAHASRRTRSQAKQMFARQVQMMLHGVAPGELTPDQWTKFLTYSDLTSTPQILLDAGGTVGPEHADHSKQVIARALLLLRIATGACHRLVKELAGLSRAELEFWWSEIGESRGLWDTGNPPTSFTDLWTDVVDAITDLNQWQATSGKAISHNGLWSEKADSAAVLSSSERTALWGIGL